MAEANWSAALKNPCPEEGAVDWPAADTKAPAGEDFLPDARALPDSVFPLVRGALPAGSFPEAEGGPCGFSIIVEELSEEDGASNDRISSANSLNIKITGVLRYAYIDGTVQRSCSPSMGTSIIINNPAEKLYRTQKDLYTDGSENVRVKAG